MPHGLLIAGRSLRGAPLRPLVAALMLALAAPVQAGWFSRKADAASDAAALAGGATSITTEDAAGAAGNAAIPAATGQANVALDFLEGAEADDEAAADADEDLVLLPSVEESDLQDDLPQGQYSAEELAALGNLWERLRAGAGIDTTVENERIEIQRNWYLRHGDYLERMSRRANRYLYHTVSEAERRGLPTELALLPIIESAYDPFAYSHANAAGMWQFIPGTATIMGVKQNEWFDGRRDVIDSTRAAYDFLTLLHRKFNDWQLVLAAYNAGPGAVQRAIDRNRAAGLPTDFWNLRLPAETRSYVPRFLAVAQIIKSPETYGVSLRPVLNQPYFRVISVRSQVDMPQAASIAGVSLKEFYQLNPGFKRQATDPEGPHRLLVPAALPLDYEADIAALPVPETVITQTHTVGKGETLFGIARKYGLSAAALRDMNRLKSDRLARGQVLTIARGNASPEYLALRQEMKLDRSPLAPRSVVKSKIYKVKRGDTLSSIARRHGVNVKTLARLNHISSRAQLRPGQVLTVKQVRATTVAKSTAGAGKGTRRITYKVRKGDTLSSISRRYNVSVRQIRNWNGASDTLNPGQGLVLYVASRVQQGH